MSTLCRRVSTSFSSGPRGRGTLRLWRRRLSSDRPLTVLGIESSCDDTGVGVVTSRGAVLGNALNSQLSVHQKTGGVVPNVARELHEEHLEEVARDALQQSQLKLEEVTHIAVTRGPGLAPCLAAGLAFAKKLALEEKKPLVPVHHMEAHALMPRMEKEIPFPYLVLLVSGGHCILGVVHQPGEFSRLGNSMDDSPGEAFDKVSRKLQLHCLPETADLPGGAAVERMAAKGDPHRFPLPVVMSRRRCCNFSFAGLKTAVLRLIDRQLDRGCSSAQFVSDVCASFQRAVAVHLAMRLQRALVYSQDHYPHITHVVVSGGVACNMYLRQQLGSVIAQFGVTLECPPPHLCSDNGVMIAWAALEHLLQGRDFSSEDYSSLEYVPKWPLGVDVCQDVAAANIHIPPPKF